MLTEALYPIRKEAFFLKMDLAELALTYDDVRMRTRFRHEPLPETLDVSSQFSVNIPLKEPFVSAAMNTVTESPMAIAQAEFGGVGVIHAAMSIEDQRREVRRVKFASNGLIDKPITVNESRTLAQVKRDMAEREFDFTTFPVVDSDGKMSGILTGRDFDFFADSLDTTTVLGAMTPFERVRSAPEGTSLREAYAIMQKNKLTMLPLLNDRRELKGMYLWSDVARNINAADKYNVDENGQLYAVAAVSTGPETMERVEALSDYADGIVIDTADGDSSYMFKTLKAIKQKYPDLDVIVGNISDGASARELAKYGADGIKVGQGPGSICTTRRETGIGMPQVSAVHACVRALGRKYRHIPVCADGGITNYGDIPIAIAAGASSVMMGKMFAGTDESPGILITRTRDGVTTRGKIYMGMGSERALRENKASRERYGVDSGVFLAEGIEAFVPYAGSVEDVLKLCSDGLRKGMRYAKAPTLDYHRKNTLLKRITHAGLRESHPHDVEPLAA
jgi:IMP dehydrogenase